MKEEFKETVRKEITSEYINEDFCPHCNEESRLIKLFDCTDRWWRCLSCLKLIYKVSMPVFGDAVPRYDEQLDSKMVQAYADFLKERESKPLKARDDVWYARHPQRVVIVGDETKEKKSEEKK